jgi:hypothetical protein
VLNTEESELIDMSIPATMRALQQTSLEGPQHMRLITDAPVPAPGPGEVLIRVAAAGVNFADTSKAHGTFLGGPRPPYVAGFEAAGREPQNLERTKERAEKQLRALAKAWGAKDLVITWRAAESDAGRP